MTTFLERAAHSVDHMFSLYFDYSAFSYFHFAFGGWVWVLMISFPCLCILFTFKGKHKQNEKCHVPKRQHVIRRSGLHWDPHHEDIL